MRESESGIYTIRPDNEGIKVIYGEEAIGKDYSDYLKDESSVSCGAVKALFFPRSIENVAFILREAQKNGEKVTISGGRTGICAGAVPTEGGYLVSLEKMTKIVDLQSVNGEYRLKSQGGIRLAELAARLRSKELDLSGPACRDFTRSKRSYFYPPDPTETTATLGGTVATNASGARTLYYGPTRNYITGIETVLSTGELLKLHRGDIREKDGVFKVKSEKGGHLVIPAPAYGMPDTKNTAGFFSKKSMDLIDLFIGSEGLLGIICTVTVRLIAEPPAIAGGVVFFHQEAKAVDFVHRVRQEKEKPLALEYFDADALTLLEEARKNQGPTSDIPEIEIPGGAVYFESACHSSEGLNVRETFARWKQLIEEAGADPQAAWGALTRRDLLRLKAFRHFVPEMINQIIAHNKLKDRRIHKVGTDMAVPDGFLKRIMKFYRKNLKNHGLDSVIFGHIGNNHVHVNMIPKNYNELKRAKELYMEFARHAVSLGGTVSAEHGIGKLKKEYLRVQFPKEAIEEMKKIKQTLDPENIFNPGNVL
jgi:D-lactate dehydrogenase (cytochrome)